MTQRTRQTNNRTNNDNASGRRRARDQRRCAAFRTRGETIRQVKLIDKFGNIRHAVRNGKLGNSNLDTILNAIDRRAQRFIDTRTLDALKTDELIAQAIDETGTITVEPTQVEERIMQLAFSSEELKLVRQVDDDLLKIHGKVPKPKQEGVVRLLYENVNGINNRMNGNEKRDRGLEMLDELEVDIAAFNEIRTNFAHRENVNGLAQLFNGGEAEVRVVNGFNTHENVGKIQEGGTAVLTYGALNEQWDNLNSGSDVLGLGRFSYSRFVGEDGRATWVVCGYQPCKSAGTSTSYQQQRRYYTSIGQPDLKPRDKFVEDFVALLQSWRDQGDRIIACLDANENIYTKRIGKALTDADGLNMREVVSDFTGKQLGATYFRGSQPIDGVWATQDIEVVGASVLPVGYGMGDHRVFLIDFTSVSMVGATPPRVKRATSRRLTTKMPGVVEKYNNILERELRRHNVDEDHRKAYYATTKEEADKALASSDRKSKQAMAHAEKKCRKIKSGRIPYSPESAVWIKRKNVYKTLLRYRAGKKVNRRNLKRSCRRINIQSPFHLSVAEIKAKLRICEEKCEHFRQHGQVYRKKHLHRCAEAARSRGDEEAERNILAMIRRERDRAFWRKLNYKLGKSKKGGSIRTVQVMDEAGEVTEHDTQEAVETAIFEGIHNQRFFLAGEAPICRGRLKGQFGYNATTAAAAEVLDGTFVFDEDYHAATDQLFQQIAKIRSLVPINSVSSLIDRISWATSWKKTNEQTSSSYSGLHFGHYKAGADSDYISNYHATKMSLALMRGISLSRWQHGLSCMLEKKAGSRLVNKLRSILLLEADMNKANKIIYGERMMQNIRRYNLMPEEIFSERNRTADEGALAKILFFDISRQLRYPAGIASVDATSCYDRIAHAMASLVFQAFGVGKEASAAMLTTIQEMKYYLRTAYGDSKNCANSTIELKYQGLVQGSTAAPAGWAAISITILMAHKENGHGATFVCPFTPEKTMNLAALLFVDDTDIIHINMDRRESVQEVHTALAASVDSWNNLLIATGGALHPDKCFYYLMSYRFSQIKGEWVYENHVEDEDLSISITMPDGTSHFIEQYPVAHAETMLGVKTCPLGNCVNQCNCVNEKNEKCLGGLEVLQQKANSCVEQVAGNKLTRHQFWTWSERCFWPKVSYGLGCLTATIDTLDKSLSKQYHKLLPAGGIIRSAPTIIRDLDSGFYGAGFPNVAVECSIQQLNKLLAHYGCSSALGVMYQASIDLFVAEVGKSHQPFSVPYKQYSYWVTNCWVKSIWEKVDYYGLRVVLNGINLPFPREHDHWIMTVFEDLGYTRAELRKLNRIRVHQQVLFLSDVFCVQGKRIDPKYKNLRREDEKWSKAKFPHEEPTRGDLRLWRKALMDVWVNRSSYRLGNWRTLGHKLIDWRYCDTECSLYHFLCDGIMDEYSIADRLRFARSRSSIDQIPCQVACTVEEITPGRYRKVSSCPLPALEIPPTTIMEVLEQWGCMWMWEDLELTGSGVFLRDSIVARTLLAVADGSYIRRLYPDICSAAFILECRTGRGRIIGKFSEKTMAACAYRGELLGLLAIHLLLLAVNKLHPDLQGMVDIYSDCLGALHRVEDLPPHRIPSRCKHSDILKTILVHCRALTFSTVFSHVSAHKLDHMEWKDLSRPEQLNEQCDTGAKDAIFAVDPYAPTRAQAFPLEPVCVFVGEEKMTTDTGDRLRFHAQSVKAEEAFHQRKILSRAAFREVDWENVYLALRATPVGFQKFACKQVFSIAATNSREAMLDSSRNPLCPSCLEVPETCHHVLTCEEESRVFCFERSVDNLEKWMESVKTDPTLTQCIKSYVVSRESRSFEDCLPVSVRRDRGWLRLAKSQDRIGWRRFMEGMISKEFCEIQESHSKTSEEQRWSSPMEGNKWARLLCIKLLEVTHGTWLVRNFLIHDKVEGMLALEKKEELQLAIEEQLELGEDGLEEEDRYLLEIKLDDLGSTSGEVQHYWLLAIRSARQAYSLRRQQPTEDILDHG